MSRVKGKGPLLTAKFTGKGKKNIPDTQAVESIMLLSIVGNEFCVGDYLKASAKQATTEFDFTTYLIADEVYWHNLRPIDTLSDNQVSDLKEHACRLGEDYFKANLDAFLEPFDLATRNRLKMEFVNKSVDDQIELINKAAETLPKKFEIVRWKTWINQPIPGESLSYVSLKPQIEKCFDEVETLKASIEKTAVNFASRHKDDGGEALWLKRSRGYLKEESPAIMWLGAKQGYNLIVYPGDMIAPFQATKDFFVCSQEQQNTATAPIPFVVATESSDQLLNWIQPFFNRSSPKAPQLTTTSPSVTGFDNNTPLSPQSSITGNSESTGESIHSSVNKGESNTISPPTFSQTNPSSFFTSRNKPQSFEQQQHQEKMKMLLANFGMPSKEGILEQNSGVSPEVFDNTVNAMSGLLAALAPEERMKTIDLLFTQVQMMNKPTVESVEQKNGLNPTLGSSGGTKM